MTNEDDSDLQISYSGYLGFKSQSRGTIDEIMAIGRRFGLEIQVTNTSLEFDYVGRDANRFIVRMLSEVAAVVGDAEGEIQCQLSGDTGQLSFEFYNVRESKLYRQIGKIVRLNEKEVILEK